MTILVILSIISLRLYRNYTWKLKCFKFHTWNTLTKNQKNFWDFTSGWKGQKTWKLKKANLIANRRNFKSLKSEISKKREHWKLSPLQLFGVCFWTGLQLFIIFLTFSCFARRALLNSPLEVLFAEVIENNCEMEEKLRSFPQNLNFTAVKLKKKCFTFNFFWSRNKCFYKIETNKLSWQVFPSGFNLIPVGQEHLYPCLDGDSRHRCEQPPFPWRHPTLPGTEMRRYKFYNVFQSIYSIVIKFNVIYYEWYFYLQITKKIDC